MSEPPSDIEQVHQLQHMVEDYEKVRYCYDAAIQEVTTKLSILDQEFRLQHLRNPIHHIESRVKTPQSMIEKLVRKGFDVSVDSATANLTDIAGVRIICSYLADIYAVSDLITSQDDISVLAVRDYIRQPKANGYRSLHLIVQVPVFLQAGKKLVPVEVQLRTIAMDFWASLEHQLRYKKLNHIPEDIAVSLLESAEEIARIDERMQNIYDRVASLNGNKME